MLSQREERRPASALQLQVGKGVLNECGLLRQRDEEIFALPVNHSRAFANALKGISEPVYGSALGSATQ